MGKGTLMTSSGSYQIRYLLHSGQYSSHYCGSVVVSCKEDNEPFDACNHPHVECPIPEGIKNWDFVRFSYTSPYTVKVLRKEPPNCDVWNLKVIRDKIALLPKVVKGKKVVVKKLKKKK